MTTPTDAATSDHNQRNRLVQAAVGEDVWRETGALTAAWDAYAATKGLSEENQIRAIREAVDDNRAQYQTIEPSVAYINPADREVSVEWTTSVSGNVHLTSLLRTDSAGEEVTMFIDGPHGLVDIESLAELELMVADMQRAVLAWRWLNRESGQAVRDN